MADQTGESLSDLFAALHAERVATWAPEQLQSNIRQRRRLAEEIAPNRNFVKPGDLVPDFAVPEVEGATLHLSELVRNGAAVLVFFRFAGCPACNVALPYYNRTLWPELQALGVPLVALSPQVPEKLADIKTRQQLGFHVATDTGNALGRRFDITFEPDEASKAASIASGKPTLADTTGTGSWELPMPTVVVVDRSKVVRFARVSPDWMDRVDTPAVLAAVRDVLAAPAAAAE